MSDDIRDSKVFDVYDTELPKEEENACKVAMVKKQRVKKTVSDSVIILSDKLSSAYKTIGELETKNLHLSHEMRNAIERNLSTRKKKYQLEIICFLSAIMWIALAECAALTR